MKQLIEPSAARQHIATHLGQICTMRKPLADCTGFILREEIQTDRPFPPFDRSMMDGYSLRSSEAECGVILEISGRAPAGVAQLTLPDAQMTAIEIMTGAIIPSGADCVVPYESTEKVDETHFKINTAGPIERGDFVHRKGSDFTQGRAILQPGRLIGSREIAAAATCGYDSLEVTKSPSIAIACSGDELVEVSQTPEIHQIRRSNDYSVASALYAAQLGQTTRHHLPDDPKATRTSLQEMIKQNDILILCGGISMGKKDFIPSVLDELGFNCHFHGIAQKPGKPMGFWSNEACSVFALPGNPLSTLTCLHHYVIPALHAAMGLTKTHLPREVTLTSSSKVREDLTVFLPVALRENNTADPSPAQNSGDLARILDSDGYIAVPAGEALAQQGSAYPFHPWH